MIFETLYPFQWIVIFLTRMSGNKSLLNNVIRLCTFRIFAKGIKDVCVKRGPIGKNARGSHGLKTRIKLPPAWAATQHSERLTRILKERLRIASQDSVNI